MKVVQINVTCGAGSTGKICLAVSQLATKEGIENYILYTSGNSNYELSKKYSNRKYLKLQALKARAFGNYGFNSVSATRALIKELKRINPDVIHLHNIHGHNCNLKLLLNYIRKEKIKLYWTFHDCWNFTAYCTHFDLAGCERWKTGCYSCPQRKDFSWFFDRSKWLYNTKKSLISNLDLTIVTPSKWLAELVKQSMFKDYPVKVINNGINLDIFKPTESDFREKHNLQGKHIVLGVAFGWGYKKGLDVFVEMSKRLPSTYQVVLVGTNESVDKLLPQNIISIHRTSNQKELAEIYTASDVFVNPTREEVLGLVNLESLACGTPVVTFNTGGSPECVNKASGIVVEKDDIDAMEKAIKEICENKIFNEEDCFEWVKAFNENEKYVEYINLYKN